MEMTMTITVPVEVSRTALALWVSGMLNMPSPGTTTSDDEYQADMDLLDNIDDEIFVTWSEEEPKS